MKCNTIELIRMRNDEHFQFFTEFSYAINKFGGFDELNVKPEQSNLFEQLYAQEDTALKKIVKSALTEEIQEADRYRDQIFRVMVDAVKTALKHPGSDAQTAGKRLKILFDTYGNIAQKPLNEETSAVYNLLQDLNGKYISDAETANLIHWMGELQSANEHLSNLMANRYEESAAKTDYVLKQVRIQMDELYRTISTRIDAFAMLVEEETKYNDFINYFTLLTDKKLIVKKHN